MIFFVTKKVITGKKNEQIGSASFNLYGSDQMSIEAIIVRID
jgi:hypothetical protein